ncbi:MAG: cytochrome P450 [Cyanobacteria bacterium J083]|nr:MAG: cytochrome P450 [Cyanobacteria bacterium J083]
MSLGDRLKNWALNNTNVTFSLLRTFKPIVIVNNTALITRFADVEEVLSRPNIFGVTYAEKMGIITNGSNFFLGMNDTAIYTRDVSNMRIVVPRTDLNDRIKPLVENHAQSLVDAAKEGVFDVVKELSELVPCHFSAEYLGVPGNTTAEFVDWNTYMFQYLFFPDNSAEVDRKAITYAAQMRTYLDELIQTRKASGEQKDDVLGRCLALQMSNTPGMSDEDIRNNLLGIIVGAIPTTSKCVAQVLNYLLDHPELLESAQTAARADEDETLRKIMLECLRFDVFAPGISRITLEDYTLAKGTWRATKITKGTPVLALTQSAMMDAHQISDPKSFRLDRPDYHYLHFGYGLHTCFGYYINMIQIPMILKAILKVKNLTREPGEAGKMEFRGPFPSHLRVRIIG